jgi:hypothetical protein
VVVSGNARPANQKVKRPAYRRNSGGMPPAATGDLNPDFAPFFRVIA